MSASGRGSRLGMDLETVEQLVVRLFKHLHVKRVRLLATVVLAALGSSRAGVAALGRSLGLQRGKHFKHAIKQIDRYLSNAGFVVEELLASWTSSAAAGGSHLLIALDWTDFGRDVHTLVASRVHGDGRVIPLMWRTFSAKQRKGRMARIQFAFLKQLRQALPERPAIIIADRGFADVALYKELERLGLFFIIRFRERHFVTPLGARRANATKFVPKRGRSRRFEGATLGYATKVRANVVLVKRGRMKAPWCLATNLPDGAERIIELYARRFTIEETFRDFKDVRFGWGLKLCRIKRHDRRDRMLLALAIASMILTVAGKAVEKAGLNRHLRANTGPRRAHSLFLQGRFAYQASTIHGPSSPLGNVVRSLRSLEPSSLWLAA